MKQSIYSQLFSKLGLSETQAKIYEFLLKNGTKTAGEISKKTEVKRGLTYNALSELEKKGIISQNTKTKVATFTPNHPEALREYIETKEKEVRDTKLSLETILPSIISDFSLISDKPGVRYSEGYDGIEKAFDLFIKEKSKDDNEKILNFFNFDIFSEDKNFIKIGDNYSKKRKVLKIDQKMIVFGSDQWNKHIEGKKLDGNTIKTIKKEHGYMFSSDINIYNNKILIISKNSSNKLSSIIIENKEIFSTFQTLFLLIWHNN